VASHARATAQRDFRRTAESDRVRAHRQRFERVQPAANAAERDKFHLTV
jgi:hypothetical protein